MLGLILLLCNSCSTDSEDPDGQDSDDKVYYIKFKYNGVQKDYRMNTLAQFYYDNNNLSYRCNLTGGLKANNAADAFTLFVVNKEALTTNKKYQMKNGIEMQNGGVMPQVIAVFLNENGKGYTAQFLSTDFLAFDDEAEMMFTEITDKYTKGTFTARVFTSAPDREELLITDGEFRLAIY
jgi:hypothetical protein